MAVNVPYTKGIVQLVGAVQGGATGSIPLHDKPSVTGDVGAQVGLVVKVIQVVTRGGRYWARTIDLLLVRQPQMWHASTRESTAGH
jgi:hypothetical protein